MERILFSIILIIFPILMYLVFICYHSLSSEKEERIAFIITIFTSMYLCLSYDIGYGTLTIFGNIPILVCYIKKEKLLGIILSVILLLVSYVKYDINLYITILKFFGYLITYILLVKRKEFDYLFLKISAIIQGFFISFEYFMNIGSSIEKICYIFIYILIIYALTFFSLYLFKLANNISLLYKTINKVQEEKKLKNSLFKLTHEIKNPIAVCKGYLDMIDLNDYIKSKKYIEIIKSEINRSLNVISDFMDYSKIKINKEEFDMVVLMEDIYESFKMLLKDKNIKFDYRNSYEDIYMMGDYERLKQVFVNIIKNSIESISSNGIIDIAIMLQDNNVIITVSDNGIGMTKEELNNIKEMFYTTKKNGTGLGVALSNEIVLAHNGILSYDSIKGVGTKCTVKLPI